MASTKVVLITGASTGFGRAAAETLARRGYTVFAAMRDTAGRNAVHSDALRSLAKGDGLRLEVLEMDVTEEHSVNSAVDEVLSRTGRIDVAINNAGISIIGLTEAFTVEQIQQLFDVNFFGAVRVNRAVLPAMRSQRTGLLIHVSSAAGRLALPTMAAYCASKFALEALADAYRFELSPFGVDSVIVEPGIHRTPILERFVEPTDQQRITEYGEAADYALNVKAVFEAGGHSQHTPGVEPVVQAFVDLIEAAPGERPLRTVPTAAIEPLLRPYNDAAVGLRQMVAQIFNVPDLLVLKR
jgi:NAD(P)-dependent dehydrogenase (short-subunit alcohol dehydrogenase family)